MRDTDPTMSSNRLLMPFLNIARGRLCYFGSRFATLHRVMVGVIQYSHLTFTLTQFSVPSIPGWYNCMLGKYQVSSFNRDIYLHIVLLYVCY